MLRGPHEDYGWICKFQVVGGLSIKWIKEGKMYSLWKKDCRAALTNAVVDKEMLLWLRRAKSFFFFLIFYN